MKTKSRRTHYEILGVKRDADPEEIKRAYRRRVLQVHPDRHPGDPRAAAKFKRVTEAYEVLSDPGRRRVYDRTLPDDENFRSHPGDGPRRPADPPPEDIPRARTNEQWRKLYEEKARQARRAEQEAAGLAATLRAVSIRERQAKRAEQEAANKARDAWKKGYNAGVRHAQEVTAAKNPDEAWEEGFKAGVRHGEQAAARKREASTEKGAQEHRAEREREYAKRKRGLRLFLYPLLAVLSATTVGGATIMIHPAGLPLMGWPLFIISLIASVVVFTYIAQLRRK